MVSNLKIGETCNRTELILKEEDNFIYIPQKYKNPYSSLEDRKKYNKLLVELNKPFIAKKIIGKTLQLKQNIKYCGFHKRSISCPNCDSKIKEEDHLSCKIHYCSKYECIASRYSDARKMLDPQVSSLDQNVLHFSIDFKTKQFKGLDKAEQIKKARKQSQRIVLNFLSKLRKGNPVKNGFRKTEKNFNPIPIKAIKLLDLKVELKNGDILIHYHFAILNKAHFDFGIMQDVRKQMLKNAKNKWAWHLQFHIKGSKRRDGRKPARVVFNYLAVRSAGVFGKNKHFKDLENKKVKMTTILKRLRKEGLIYFFSDFLTEEEYIKSFYNAKVLSGIGLNLYSCIKGESSTDRICFICGYTGKFRVTTTIIIKKEVIPPPPPQFEVLSNQELEDLCKGLYGDPLNFYEDPLHRDYSDYV